MPQEVVVYGRPGCGKCVQTCKQFDALGVPHTYVNVEADREAASKLRQLGFNEGTTLPVVAVTKGGGEDGGAKHTEYWSDFRIDLIRGLERTRKQ